MHLLHAEVTIRANRYGSTATNGIGPNSWTADMRLRPAGRLPMTTRPVLPTYREESVRAHTTGTVLVPRAGHFRR